MKASEKRFGYCWLLAVGILSNLLLITTGFAQYLKPVKPLRQGHSHNDYWRPQPLHNALQLGFKSVEADIFLKDGQLLVGHSLNELKPENTLESLYLQPLNQIIKQHKKLYTSSEELYLYIDFKTEGQATYQQLKPLLQQYESILVKPGKPRAKGFIKIILTGGYPQELILNDKQRLVFLDGKVQDLPQNLSRLDFPVVSGNWNQHFKWRGQGPIPTEEAEKLKNWNAIAKKNKQQIRFWNMPEKDEAALKNIWQELLKYESVLIGTDHLDWLHSTLIKHQRR